MNRSRNLRATMYLLSLMLVTGCYKSVQPNEDAADSDSDSSETDDIESTTDDVTPTTDDVETTTDLVRDSLNLHPCIRESSFIDEEGNSSLEKSFFFYNNHSKLITAYVVEIPAIKWRFSSSIELVSEAIVPFLGTEYWNICTPPNESLVCTLSHGMSQECFWCNPLILRFRIGDDATQIIFEAANGEDDSVFWQERLSADRNDNSVTWEASNSRQSLAESRVVFLQDDQERPTEQNLPDVSDMSQFQVTTVSHGSKETTKIENIDPYYDWTLLYYNDFVTLEYVTFEYNTQEEIISYTKLNSKNTIKFECTYDDQGNLLRRKESYSSKDPLVGALISLASDLEDSDPAIMPDETKTVIDYDYAYNKLGEIASSKTSYNNSDSEEDSTFTLFTEFRYELDDSGRITKIDMGKSAEKFDAMLEYEYDDDGNMTLAEYSTIGGLGPVVTRERMINKYDEFGRLSKTEFNELLSGAQSIHQYSYDCRSYQFIETSTD